MASTFKLIRVRLRLRKWRDDSYNILIRPGLFHEIPQRLKAKPFAQKYCIITDSRTKKLYGQELLDELREEGLDATMISFQAGERSKSLKTVENLATQMTQLGHNRTSGVISLGGGVVGDIAGFVASIFMRGIPFIQVPTTLVAMADSSIGGKTGVDLRTGKNLVGTITQPKAIYIDPQLISTLPEKQIINGLAEVVKHGLIADRATRKILEKWPERARSGHTTTITKLLERSCRVKARIVEKDERESQRRMLLNYGHTIGHAIEHASGYRLNHGQAIAIGMNLENRLAVDLKLQKPKHCEQMETLLQSLGLPTTIPEKIDRAPILEALKHDKKHGKNGYRFTLVKRPGKPVVVEGITPKQVKAVL